MIPRRTRRRIQKQRSWPRAGITVGCVLAVAAAVVALVSTPRERKVTFHEARWDPQLRPTYVRQLAERPDRPHVVEAIRYVDTRDRRALQHVARDFNYPEEEILRGTTGMSAVVEVSRRIPIELLGTRPVPVTILVFPYAFDGSGRFQTEEDLLSGLSHEFLHATEFHNRARVGSIPFSAFETTAGELNTGLIKVVGEFQAFRMELTAQPARISAAYRRDRMQQYLEEFVELWTRADGMDPAFMEQLKVQFFEPWMLEHRKLHKEELEGEETWYFERAEDLYRFSFTPSEIRRIRANLAGGE